MEDTTDKRHHETCDRLALLLISRPREGWDREFEELTRREIERLNLVADESEHDD